MHRCTSTSITASFLFVLAAFLLGSFSALCAEMTTGMPIKLKLLETIRSGRSRRGDLIRFAVVDNVLTDDGKILIPKGAKAFGTVTNSRRAGMFGKRGSLDFSVDYAYSWENKKVSLRAHKERRGGGSKGGTIAAGLLITPIAFLFKGSNISVAEGTELTAYIDDEINPGAPVNQIHSGRNSKIQELIAKMKDKHTAEPEAKGLKKVCMFNGDFYIGSIVSQDAHLYVLSTKSGEVNLRKADVESVQTVVR